MRFETVPVEKAEGAILAHSVLLPEISFKKGRKLSASDVAALASHGARDVMVARLEQGDMVVLYTDGITECRNSAGTPLGIGGFLALAEALPLGPPTTIGPMLISSVDGFRGTTPSIDDETVVVLQRLSDAPGRGE